VAARSHRPANALSTRGRTPPPYARGLKQAGFTVMNVANNHALDYGPVGRAQTLAALRKVGLKWTGRPRGIAYQQMRPTSARGAATRSRSRTPP
jgi:poly-gamma-glutamate capsule biosynthesis protein CapA/YwtB (metallophosphatase superfamily)